MNKKVIISVVLMALIVSFYRIMPKPEGVWGITPMFSIALFSGSLFRTKKIWAFLLPTLALFFSDVLWQMIDTTGFYKGQLWNYMLLVGVTFLGFLIRKIKILNVVIYSLLAPTLYFLFSNFLVWITGGGFNRPKTIDGLLQTYIDGWPFYFPWQLLSTLLFSIVLFGGLYWISNLSHAQAITPVVDERK